MQIFIAIVALSFLIIVHEFGHFIVAKMSGIKVLEFSLFMGPKLFSVQRGETVYSLRAVPLGGFVRMEGEEEASNDARAFNQKPKYIRAAVIAAGPLMNLLVAILILTMVYSFTGFSSNRLIVAKNSPAANGGLQTGDKVIRYDGKRVFNASDVWTFNAISKGEPATIEVERGPEGERITKTVIPEKIPAQNRYILGFAPKENEGPDSNIVGGLTANSNAAKAGLKVNDRIVKLNGKVVENRQQIAEFMKENQGNPVIVTVRRNGIEETLPVPVTPILDEQPEQYSLGIGFQPEKGNLVSAAKYSAGFTLSITRSVYYSVVWLATGKVPLNQLMGPVGIVSTIGDVVAQNQTLLDKLFGLLSFTAFISINLGVFNLIPFPALDGSKLLLIAIEGIRRKSIPPEKEAFISMVGLVLLIMLMIFATSNDIMRILGRG